TLFINPTSGIAGDMFVASLLALGRFTEEDLLKQLKTLSLPADEWSLTVKKVLKHGIGATHVDVHVHDHSHDHHHGRHLSEIVTIINNSTLSLLVKEKAIAIFNALGEAEASVHQIDIEKIHFHEVGAVDAIIDIVGACIALELLDVNRVVFAPVELGSGTVKCAHGTMPVPVPAVSRLLEGIPTVIGTLKGECCTPTGAAIVKVIADSFAGQVAGSIQASGYGAGTRDYDDHANVLQAILIDESVKSGHTTSFDEVAVIECNIDDMSGEQLTHIIPNFIAAGALDVVVIPCLMKKGRQGMVLQLICDLAEREALAKLILTETTSFGVRMYRTERLKLSRKIETIETAFGKIRVKLGFCPDTSALLHIAPEYEDCSTAAKQHRARYAEVYESALSLANQRFRQSD
ncbi:nickel pincer cofactor biosynthesis protein LarC, partial [bacterium AH-315-E10]|nr:nickel pincer cofactor biosynthesis protein LarC [bacterium AH-315-E10]